MLGTDKMSESLNGYDAIREKLDEGNTMTVKQPVESVTKPKTKVSEGWVVLWISELLFVWGLNKKTKNDARHRLVFLGFRAIHDWV